MSHLIVALVQATKEADEYCPGFRKQHLIRYLESLHYTTFDSTIDQLEELVKEELKTAAIRSNSVMPV